MLSSQHFNVEQLESEIGNYLKNIRPEIDITKMSLDKNEKISVFSQEVIQSIVEAKNIESCQNYLNYVSRY